jgi:hypothetical protein
MKIFWLITVDKETQDRRRCFFRLTEDGIKEEVRCRVEDLPIDNKLLGLPNDDMIAWEYEEDNVSDNLFGYCINGLPNQERPSLTLPYMTDCAVGAVRKYRNGVEDDDGTCKTCPYFRKEKPENDGNEI